MNQFFLFSLLCQYTTIVTYAFHATITPPLLDVPVFSLSTLGDEENSESTMNILTYASPISIKPDRMWSISLYKGTMSHDNFIRERRGILQMLRGYTEGETEKTGKLIQLLGGSSGRDVDKESQCAELGYTWEQLLPEGEEKEECWPDVLPSCAYYLKLELVHLIDCGSHEVALCKVVSMVSDEKVENAADELDALSTKKLREDSIISEFGRAVPLEVEDKL